MVKDHLEPYLKDHLGNHYNNLDDLCNTYHITKKLYYDRTHKGWSLEKILTTPLRDNSVKDHLGNIYKSKKALCTAYNINVSTFDDRIKHNWSLKDALTKPLQDVSCEDHTGTKYKNVKEMCKHYNIKPSIYHDRIRHGYSIKDALTTPVKDFDPIEFEGKTYASLNALCETYGKSNRTVAQRLKNGIDLKAALTTDGVLRTGHITYDHEGNAFRNKKEMCAAYGLTWTTVRDRMNMQNMSLEEALTLDKPCSIPCVDPYGTKFDSITSMCKHYDRNRAAYREDIVSGYTIAEALNIIPKLSNRLKEYELDDIIIIKPVVSKPNTIPLYFLCSYIDTPVTQEFVMSRYQLLKKFNDVYNMKAA